MDYAATLKRIGELTKAVASAGRRLGYELRGTTEEAVSRRVMIRDAKFAADSEPYRRNRDLRQSTIKDLMGEESAAAQARASVARSLVERPAQEPVHQRPQIAVEQADLGIVKPAPEHGDDSNGPTQRSARRIVRKNEGDVRRNPAHERHQQDRHHQLLPVRMQVEDDFLVFGQQALGERHRFTLPF